MPLWSVNCIDMHVIIWQVRTKLNSDKQIEKRMNKRATWNYDRISSERSSLTLTHLRRTIFLLFPSFFTADGDSFFSLSASSFSIARWSWHEVTMKTCKGKTVQKTMQAILQPNQNTNPWSNPTQHVTGVWVPKNYQEWIWMAWTVLCG